MNIIYHTASLNKNKENFIKLLNEDVQCLELDFVLTKDFIPIWSHSRSVNFIPIKHIKKNSKLLRNYLTLKDIIDLNNGRKKLLLDFKYIDKRIIESNYLREIINKISKFDNIMIQSTSTSFIKYLIQEKININKGLIINYFTSFNINEKNIGILKEVDFISVASELWEGRHAGFLDECKKNFSKAKIYAWTWDALYNESTDRLTRYIKQGADGIITNKPNQVKTLLKNKKEY